MLSQLCLMELPEFVNDITVIGNFYCADNNLKTLKNSPRWVKGFFSCWGNPLESLEGCPTYVKDNFLCYGNPVKFTEEYVRSICEVGGKVYV